MNNREIAELFSEIADYLEVDENQFRSRAYRTAARNIESLSEDVQEIYERDELEEIEGVGGSLAEKIAEYLETGTITYYEELKADLPIDMEAITLVEGIGPKTAEKLYQALGIKTLDDLEQAARSGQIATVTGFGEQTQQNILDNIATAKKSQERMLLGRAFPIAERVKTRLLAADPFERVDIVGSFRRRRPTIGDIDILATATDSTDAMEFFCTNEDVNEVLARGETKSSVVVSGDLHMDLRLVDASEYGAALIYFTGSKNHNITLRNRAIDRGLKLNEYGLFDDRDVTDAHAGQRAGKRIASETEQAVYNTLDLEWIPPELREDTGELDAAASGTLPVLVEAGEIRGDVQVHTEYSDGSHTVSEMARAADERGLEYIVITDHGPGAPIPSKVDADSFAAQRAEIDDVNADMDLSVSVLHGIEAEITTEGLDIPIEWCETCDVVVAGLHSRPTNPTETILRAFEHSSIDVFAHPRNRLINKRDPVDLDLDLIMQTAADQGIAIEINAQPARLDLDWASVKAYRDTVKYVISTDAHTAGEFDLMHFGVSQARRGWCEPPAILNTRPLAEFTSWFGH